MTAIPVQQNTDRRFEDYLFVKQAERVGIYVFIVALALFNLIPFVWLFVSAFGVRPEGFSSLYLYLPAGLTLENFGSAFDPKGGDVLRAMLNSLVTIGGAVLLAITVCTLAAYALSRARFRGRRELMY